MFEGFSGRTIDFMWNLRFNNNKSWFEAHKNEFICDFQRPMKALGQDVFDRISDTFGERGFILKISRIYKDARRVRGGEPYKTNLWFSIERPSPSEERASALVFWFELEPEKWSYGLGYYQARPETMAKLRARIDKNPKSFEKLIAPLSEQDEFILDGQEYIRKKVAPTIKTSEWYKKNPSRLYTNKQTRRNYSPLNWLTALLQDIHF